jgi:hypothetical protein
LRFPDHARARFREAFRAGQVHGRLDHVTIKLPWLQNLLKEQTHQLLLARGLGS